MPIHDSKGNRTNSTGSKDPTRISNEGRSSNPLELSANPLSARGLLQMQSALGNQAVLQMVRERRNAIVAGSPLAPAASVAPEAPLAARPGSLGQSTGGPAAPMMGRPGNLRQSTAAQSAPIAAPPGNLSPPVGPAANELASSAAPTPATEQLPSSLSSDLTERPLHKEVYVWLKEEAARSKKTGLFSFFDQLDPQQKLQAIDAICGGARMPSIGAAKSVLETGLIRKSLDWDRFSEIVRAAKNIEVTNYNADTARDYASYTAVGTSGLAGGTSGSASISATLGAGGASGVATGAAPAAAGLGGLAALSQVYNAAQDYDGGLSVGEKARIVSAEGGGGTGDLARSSALAVNNVRAVAGMGASGAATMAAGIGGVVGGAAYMVGGIAGYHAGRKGAKNLANIEARMSEQAGDERADKLALAAHLGGSTQEMNKSKSGATAVKGALMVAGGAVMIAAAASPIGPALLAAAAILGGVAAVIKFYKKHKRKEQFVDKVLKVDEEMQKPENQKADKAKVRQSMIEAHGFNSVSQCYNQIVTDLAGMLYTSGVEGSDPESISIIENIGLKIDQSKGKPTKEMIAKKLHT